MSSHSISYGVETENHLGFLTEYYGMNNSELIRKLIMHEYGEVVQYINDMKRRTEGTDVQ